jgi:3-methyladenine DNA glycosylase AlkC
MEPFKNLLGGAVVDALAEHLARAATKRAPFDRALFRRRAEGLDALELKARARHLAAAVAAALPPDFEQAADVIEQCLAPPQREVDLGALQSGPDGVAGWAIWPLTEYVAEHGLPFPDRALPLLHALTQRHTAEFALRPFVVAHHEKTFAALRRWLHDPSAHVRRLVSEGTRPLLPWGMRLDALVEDPSPTLPLLERLQDDPSDYVRRSVANHLNDVAKNHPALVADWIERHLPAASSERAALLRHAARTLVKRGDRRVLAAFGFGQPLRGGVEFTIAPKRVPVGGAVVLTIRLVSTARTAQQLAVDYRVHHPKSCGRTSAKVWKGFVITLPAGAEVRREKRHSLRPVTTRRDYPGEHKVELLVNGRTLAESAFDLRA